MSTPIRERIAIVWPLLKVAPLRVKVVAALTLLYLMSPIDIIPDFIPVIGQLDDLLIAGAALGYITRQMPELAAALKGELSPITTIDRKVVAEEQA